MYFGERLREFLVVLFYFSDDIGKTKCCMWLMPDPAIVPREIPFPRATVQLWRKGGRRQIASVNIVFVDPNPRASIHWGKVLSHVQFEALPHLIPIWSKSSKRRSLFHTASTRTALCKIGVIVLFHTALSRTASTGTALCIIGVTVLFHTALWVLFLFHTTVNLLSNLRRVSLSY